MLRVGIVGCGKIADSHASQILRIDGCRIVAACDHEELMAQQFCDRFPAGAHFDDLSRFLSEARPDVVHITTPPSSHFAIASECLEAGCHIYVEKPFTLYTKEAVELLKLADKKGLKVTVGHDDQFSHVARRMRQLINDGYLGGPPVHMESHYCYNMGTTSYAKALLGDKEHWVRKLPGKLLHNVISHGVARIAEHLESDTPQVMTHGFVSRPLREAGEDEIIDELRAIVSDPNGVTATFTFSSQMKPALHQFRIYGPENGLFLDEDKQTLIKLNGKQHKSYVEKFIPTLGFAAQYSFNGMRNVGLFLKRDFHMKSGMKHLAESFYRAIQNEGPLPIPYREILLTSRIMESMFEQLQPATGGGHPEEP